MKRKLISIISYAILLAMMSGASFSQTRYTLPAEHVVPGRPWTNMIPDPDKFDWSTKNGARPGYQYRGMLPMQQKFYDYIQEKNRANIPLTTAEQATIRWLITSRRWPEAPRPNAFWAAFMRYLREQTTLELNVAQAIMFDQLVSRGLVPVDRVPNADFQKVRDYLNSGPFRPRNWFERIFGRVEPWMDNLYSGMGFDLRPPGAPGGNVFPPGDPFNGLKVSYNVSGATLSAPTDVGGFTIRRSHEGVLGTGTLTVSGTARVGGYGADVSVSVWAGDKKEEKKFYIKNEGNAGNPQNFSVSVPIPAGARTGGFAINLDGRYSMGGGHRGCYVTGSFGPSKAQLEADRAAADAKWRKEVEETLARLGYENTPEGKEIEEMRAALAGGDAAWKAFVDKRLAQMAGDNSRDVAEYKELESAIINGGEEWDRYIAKYAKGPSPATQAIKAGESLHTERKYKEAIEQFDEAIRLDPGNYEAYRLRARAKREAGDVNGAIADFTKAIEIDPKAHQAYLGRGLALEKAGDRAGAMRDFDEGIALVPSYAAGYGYRGRLKYDMKDYNGAIADLDKAIAIDPKGFSPHFNRALTRAAFKDWAAAIADYTRAIEIDPKSAAAHNNRGVMKQQLGDLEGSLADYEAALALLPTYQTAQSNITKVNDLIAKRKSPVPTGRIAPGKYIIVANNFREEITLTFNGDRFTGTIGSERITNGLISGNTVTFHKTLGSYPQGQDYKGTIQGNKIVGTFTGAPWEIGREFWPFEIYLTPISSR